MRAKFVCRSITEVEGGSKEAKLSAVYSEDTKENADFTKYTPQGELSIWISPETPAVNYFKPGKNYYLDFTEVE